MDPNNLDYRFTLWQRNVSDHLKDVPNDQIKNYMKEKAPPCAVLMTQVEGDFNFGNVVRTANSFGIVDFFYYGKKRFDSRAACGAHHYINLHHYTDIHELAKLKEDYAFVALENNIDSVIPIHKFSWPTDKKTMIVIGEESKGIVNSILQLCDYRIEIPSCGSIRSLNAGSAAAIAIYDYWSKRNV